MSVLSVPATCDAVVTVPPETAGATISAESLGTRLRDHPIIVPVSGEREGAGPVRLASALESRFGSVVLAIQAIDVSDVPLLTSLPSPVTLAHEPIGDNPYANHAGARRRQFDEWLARPTNWSVRITPGAAAYEIVRYAERQDAALIILGLRRHGIEGRVRLDETTLTVARGASCPVLAVVPTLRTLPRRAIIAVDFGPDSVRVARAALDVMAPPGADGVVLRLVHVDQHGADGHEEDAPGAALVRRLGVDAAFEQLVSELRAPPGVHVECAGRHGTPATQLLACAADSRADLIALGRRRTDRRDQWMLGSVATEVIRDGRCSVLAIPTSTT